MSGKGCRAGGSTIGPDRLLTLDEALDRLPKVELHCHVEGTMRRETLVALAERRGLALPTRDPLDLYRFDSLDATAVSAESGQAAI